MKQNKLRQTLVTLICAGLVSLGMPAQAEMIGTGEALGQEARAARVAELRAFLARDEVRDQLTALGVAPEAAAERVAALTDVELQHLATQLDELPAGGDGAGVVLVLLLVLIVLEVLGAIDIFTKI